MIFHGPLRVFRPQKSFPCSFCALSFFVRGNKKKVDDVLLVSAATVYPIQPAGSCKKDEKIRNICKCNSFLSVLVNDTSTLLQRS